MEHAAEDDDAADGIGHAHQWCMKRRSDIPYDLPTDEAGKDEHREVAEELTRGPEPDGDDKQDSQEDRDALDDSGGILLPCWRGDFFFSC